MAYTVGKLARISNVSVRALHWWDEIGLLKPIYSQENGYRYYKEEHLLQLQQILFFRQFGFKLKDIKEMLMNNDFDNRRALLAHKEILEEKTDTAIKLIATIDKTLFHLKKKENVKAKDLYIGFKEEKKKGYKTYLVKYQGTLAEDLLLESKKRETNLKDHDLEEINGEGDAIYKGLSQCIERNLNPRSTDVQTFIHRHYQMTQRFYKVTKDIYMGLAQLYCEHPDFKKCFKSYHPKIIEFIGEGMRVYAHKNLS